MGNMDHAISERWLGAIILVPFLLIICLMIAGKSMQLINEGNTVLVGIGCNGGSYVAVAREEDNLPECAEIERHHVQ